MSGKLIASFLLAGGLSVATAVGFLVGGPVVGIALLSLSLGQLALAHLAFLEERRRRSGRVGPLPWLNLGMSYLLVAMALGLFLMKTFLDDSRKDTIAKAGQAPGDETEGQKIPESLGTDVASGGERARLGNVGRGEGDDATKGGANEDNQNAMREAQVFDPEIAGAAEGTGEVTNVSAEEAPDQVDPGEADIGQANAVDQLLARVGEDDESVDVGKRDAELVFEEDDESLAFDVTVFRGEEKDPEERRLKGEVVRNVRSNKNSLGIAVPKSMSGRCDKLGRKAKLLRAQVQNPEAVELAVTKALDWLTLNQNEDGSWGKTAHGAMTGFALLCYLGHCELTDSAKYGEAVSDGIKYLVELGDKKNGWLYTTNNRHGAAYAHGIASYAMAEAYSMTEKEFILPVLQKAIHRIVAGQKQDGGWFYLEQRKGPNGLRFDDFGKNEKAASDTSVSGWQFQALKAAYNSGVLFPGIEPALEAAVKNFYRVYSPKSGGFGYRKASDSSNVSHKLTGVGALGLQSWKFGHPSEAKRKEVLRNAVRHIKKRTQGISYDSGDSNLYSWYYDAQALFNYGGINWISWNRWMEPMLIKAQNDDGSWPAEGSGLTTKRGGKDKEIYRTALCTLMLEVYYRYVY